MYEAIYEQNRELLVKMAGRWAARCRLDPAVDVEDLAQAGFFGLLRAADTWDATAGKSWAGWAGWFIRREFESALGLRDGKPNRAHVGALALDDPIPGGEEEGITFKDQLPDDSLPDIDADVLLDDVRVGIREALERLKDQRGREVVRGCDLDGKTLHEAAQALQISTERARQLRNRAYKELRKDPRLRALADLEARTRYHAHKGVGAFERDLTSVTEGAALWRIQQRARLESRLTAAAQTSV